MRFLIVFFVIVDFFTLLRIINYVARLTADCEKVKLLAGATFFYYFFGYFHGNADFSKLSFLSCRTLLPIYIGFLSFGFGLGNTTSFVRLPSLGECITFLNLYSSTGCSPTINAGCPDFLYRLKCGNLSALSCFLFLAKKKALCLQCF